MTDHTPIETHDNVVDLTAPELRRRSRPAGDNVVLLLPDVSADPATEVRVDEPLIVRLREALDATNEIILVVEPAGRVLFANRPARAILGLADADPTFRALESLLTGANREAVWSALDEANEWHGDLPASRADGSTMHLELTLLADRTATGDVRTLTVLAHDVGEHRALQTALEHRSTHDGLTGLANRQHLLAQISEQLGPLHERGLSAALLLIDIDEFRTVTNSLGHESGDRVLIAFAYRLLRTFPTSAVLARVGGDEFGVFCPGVDDIDHLAEQVMKATHAPFYIDGTEVQLSVVTGIATSSPDQPAANGEALLREADAACYRAKENGRGSFEVFEPHLQAQAADRLSSVADLRRGIRNDEFVLLYQPKIALETGRIIGAEALVRWQPSGGPLRTPDQFLGIAEDTGLIIPIGRAVLNLACEAAIELQAAAPAGERLDIAVNLSVRQLDHPSFPGDAEDIFRDTGVDPSLIEFEITESALMEDVGASASLLTSLKRLGTRIAVDDFGTGYSSLQYLQALPVDVLKVDRTFVSGLEDDHGSKVITGAVVRLASALGLVSVAEGVETASQLEALRRIGCTHAQGYYIARPMPFEDLVALVRTNPSW